MSRVYIAFSYLTLFSFGFIDNSRGPLYPEILEFFLITKAEGSLMFSLASLFSFLATLCSGFWLRRIGLIRSTKISLIIDILALIFMGAMPAGQVGYYGFLLASIFFGFSCGVKSIAVNYIIGSYYEGVYKRKVFSGLHSMYGIASLLAPLVVTFLIEQNLAWNIVIQLIGLMPLITLGLFFKLKKEKPIEPAHQKLLAGQPVLSTGVLLSFYVASEVVVSSRLVLYGRDFYDLSGAQAAFYLTLFFMGLLAGRLLFTFTNFKFKNLTLLKLSVILSIVLLTLGLRLHPSFLSLSGLSMSIFFPCFMSLISSKYDSNSGALISRSMQSVGAALVSFHFIFGLVATEFGLKIAMAIPILLLIVVAFILFTERRLVEKDI